MAKTDAARLEISASVSSHAQKSEFSSKKVFTNINNRLPNVQSQLIDLLVLGFRPILDDDLFQSDVEEKTTFNVRL